MGLRRRSAAGGPFALQDRRHYIGGQAQGAEQAMIRESIVITQSRAGLVHIAPIGLIEEGGHLVIAPFRPSLTLDNLRENPFAVANYTDDVLVFAGCLTGRREWPTRRAAKVVGAVLAQALAHAELRVVGVTEDAVRP